MGQEHVDVLKQARENFVRKRRVMAEQMVPGGAAAAHFAPAFSDLQVCIEALDRAILDEGNLPDGYGAGGDEVASPDDGTVVRVDFEADPA